MPVIIRSFRRICLRSGGVAFCSKLSTGLAPFVAGHIHSDPYDTEAGQMIEVTDVDLASMIHNIVAELALKLEERQMTVGVNVDKLVLQGNSSLLYSIFPLI